MKYLGLVLLIIGVLSLILPFTGAEFMFLSWVSNWGETIGWAIRIGIVLLGAALYLPNRHDD
jgi:hypothetical protein